ncbi:MgtC/SapB family protein [Treponema sp. OMZ 840]|uniref:MgtC/SapB family protein n=1 Tax=Treponema sp. OMZ 840 TaxID=244313 RepID=UPI003D8CAC8C
MNFEDIYDLLFGKDISWYACLARILLSMIAGAVLGLERKIRQQFVGMRTLILISVASTVLMLLSIYTSGLSENGVRGDPSRIAAQVVSGIGFLGAGTILRQGLNIKGLTSSAIIWVAAALGLTIGSGFIVPALIALFVCEVCLISLEKVEEKYFPAERVKHLNLVFENKRIDLVALNKLIVANGLIISTTDITRILGQKHLNISFTVKVPPSLDIFALTDKIKQIGRLEEFSLTD